MISWVFPGLDEVLASFLWLASILIREDLPTLDRPIKANSGLSGGGQSLTELLLFTKVALFISDFKVCGNNFFADKRANLPIKLMLPYFFAKITIFYSPVIFLIINLLRGNCKRIFLMISA